MGTALDAVTKLTAVAQKLLHETERLRRDVANLSARLQPVKKGQDSDAFDHPLPMPKVKWVVADALNMINVARTHILNCEYELRRISGLIENIASDAISREEMKPWIKGS